MIILWCYVPGKFCGGDLPLPNLIGSNSIRLKLVSDYKDYGTGFSITSKTLTPDILPGKFKQSNGPAYTLGWGPGKKMLGENKPEEAPVVFLCGWCFHGGPWGRQLRLKHIMENCVWFCCAQQFTIPEDGPEGHLVNLNQTPDVPVLAAFPARSFFSIFVCLDFKMLFRKKKYLFAIINVDKTAWRNGKRV